MGFNFSFSASCTRYTLNIYLDPVNLRKKHYKLISQALHCISPLEHLLPVLQFTNVRRFKILPLRLALSNLLLTSRLQRFHDPIARKAIFCSQIASSPSQPDRVPPGSATFLTFLPPRAQKSLVCGRGQASIRSKSHAASRSRHGKHPRILNVSTLSLASPPPLGTRTNFLHLCYSPSLARCRWALQASPFFRQSIEQLFIVSHSLPLWKKKKLFLQRLSTTV